MSAIRSKTVTIPNGGYESNIISVPPDAYISTIFVPAEIVGTNLLFFGDNGDGVMRQLNFSFSMSSTTPYYKGQVVGDLSAQLVGLTRLQFRTLLTEIQTQDIVISMGLTY